MVIGHESAGEVRRHEGHAPRLGQRDGLDAAVRAPPVQRVEADE